MYKTIYFVICIAVFTLYSCKDDVDYSNNEKNLNLSKNVHFTRDKITKDATLVISGISQNWKVYAGSSISTINQSLPILEKNISGSYKLPVSNDYRSYFLLVSNNQSLYFSEKHLPLEGGYNFRDLGGLPTLDGKTVKWGKLFRADEFKNLTDKDLSYLSSIPLLTNVDFRSPDEIKAAPHRIPQSLQNRFELSINPGNLSLDLSSIDIAQADSFMIKLNIQLVTDSVSINQYRSFFKLLQNEDYLPLIFNCSAGKDRTGLATALILYSLNVDEDIIFEDYLASNIYLADKYTSSIEEFPHLKPLFEVRREFLKAGIDNIKKNYGTVQNYLVRVLNVDLDKMKQLYLYQ